VNGQSTAVIGAVSQTLAPLSGYLGTGTIQSGFIDISVRYEPIYIADTGNNRIVSTADALGSNWLSLGKAGSGVQQFSQPWGVALDATRKIYISDSGNCRIVRVDNISGANWTSYGTCGAGPGQFQNPQGLSVDAAGRIYVADTGNNRIVRMDDMSGTNRTALGSLGSGVSQFNQPSAVTTDTAGNIYVADNQNARVVEFSDMTGANWAALQFPLGYETPDGVAVDSTNRIYLTDSLQSQIFRADNIAGANEVSLSASGAGFQGVFSHPTGLFVDSDGAIYVADTGNSRALRFFDLSYNDESQFGTLGTGVGNLSAPHGIAATQIPKRVAVPSVNPGGVAFPTEVVGVASPPATVLLTNLGSQPFSVSGVSTSLPDFAETNNCPATLAGGESCSASVIFEPTTGGARKGALNFAVTGATARPAGLGGFGALVTVSPSQLILYDGASGTVTITNPLTTSTTLASIQISGPTFRQKNNCGTLAPGASCQVTISWLYSGVPVLGTLVVTDSSGTRQYVSITGE
jgi:sugar lactone lactonase YvrE